MSSLSCFFGVELRPDGVPFTPVIPPKSSLVITQCAVTSAVPSSADVDSATTSDSTSPAAAPAMYSAVTLYVQSGEVPARLAVCTLNPGQQLYFCPLQLLFDKWATFTLVPQHQPPKTGAPAAYPSVHLTGYYEKEDEEDEEDEEEAYLSGADESEEEEAVAGRAADPRIANGGKHPRPPSRAGGKRLARH